MQFITVIAALFASSALAAPQWGWDNNGNEEVSYYDSCTCLSYGYKDPTVAQAACNALAQNYPNLYWNGDACVDFNGLGLEYEGFQKACEEAGFIIGADPNIVASCTY